MELRLENTLRSHSDEDFFLLDKLRIVVSPSSEKDQLVFILPPRFYLCSHRVGRGRGRVQEAEVESEEDSDEDDDDEIDSDELDSEEDDDEHDEESDDMPREGQLALSLLDVCTAD